MLKRQPGMICTVCEAGCVEPGVHCCLLLHPVVLIFGAVIRASTGSMAIRRGRCCFRLVWIAYLGCARAIMRPPGLGSVGHGCNGPASWRLAGLHGCIAEDEKDVVQGEAPGREGRGEVGLPLFWGRSMACRVSTR